MELLILYASIFCLLLVVVEAMVERKPRKAK
jgi:hypothetical protein